MCVRYMCPTTAVNGRKVPATRPSAQLGDNQLVTQHSRTVVYEMTGNWICTKNEVPLTLTLTLTLTPTPAKA